MTKPKTISLKVPSELDDRLTSAAAARGRTKSSLIREAVATYLVDVAPPKLSFAEQAADLRGCLRGPKDLSTNPDHLTGYGE